MSNLFVLQEYFNWFLNIYQTKDSLKEPIYRGQSDVGYKLQPSAFREHSDTEYHIIQKAKYHACEQLRSCCSYLDKLVYLQHYELNTRLLDFTFNPFVALYFACCNSEKWNKDGEVVVIREYCADESCANVISEYIFNNEIDTISINKLNQLAEKYHIDKDLIDRLSRPIFFYPSYNNGRIRQQKGFFAMAPLLESFQDNCLLGFKRTAIKNEVVDYDFRGVFKEGNYGYDSFIVQAGRKADYLSALACVGIDESTLFPELEHLCHTLNSKEQKLIEKCYR